MTSASSHDSVTDPVFDLLVIGAGPTGLACAIEAQKAGFLRGPVDKGCLCNSLFHYPAHMTFFTTSELLEIGGIPFSTPNAKPSRNEALEYYRKVARFYKLDVRQYQRVECASPGLTGHSVQRIPQRIVMAGRDARCSQARCSIGYYDLPNMMGIPGEDLNKVNHYYNDPHPYSGLEVAVIGGKNSAAIAALELWRHGAHVTLIYRGPAVTPNVKYWIKPDIENRIKNGQVTAYFKSEVEQITPDTIIIETPEGRRILPNDFVFALTGYHPDFDFLERLGVECGGCRSHAGLPPGDARKQHTGNISGWGDCGRRAHQRNIH